MSVYWCRSCGMCWAADEPPICKHGAPDSPSAGQVMDPIPSWHPMAPEVSQ